jgi:hypothetical protein
LNWNTAGGDLLVAHFLGLRAVQVLPPSAWVINKHQSTDLAGQRLSKVTGAGGKTISFPACNKRTEQSKLWAHGSRGQVVMKRATWKNFSFAQQQLSQIQS